MITWLCTIPVLPIRHVSLSHDKTFHVLSTSATEPEQHSGLKPLRILWLYWTIFKQACNAFFENAAGHYSASCCGSVKTRQNNSRISQAYLITHITHQTYVFGRIKSLLYNRSCTWFLFFKKEVLKFSFACLLLRWRHQQRRPDFRLTSNNCTWSFG